MNRLRWGPATLGLALLLSAWSPVARADHETGEVGKKVQTKARWVFVGPDGKKIEIAPGAEGKGVVLPLHLGQFPGTGWAPRIQGKMVFVGPDGKKHEIDLAKAGKGIFPLRIQTVGSGQHRIIIASKDGKTHALPFWGKPPGAQAHGKMTFIGPDGKKHEIELGKIAQVQRGALRLFALRGSTDFMLGLDCEPASAVLRAHLGLDKGVGLVVKSALEGTPANKAGLRPHDVLVGSGKRSLTSVADLVKAVQEAGKEGKSVQLDLIRAGKKTRVEVKPAQRKPVKIEVEGKKGAGTGGFSGRSTFGFSTFSKPKDDRLEKRLEELSKKIEKLEKAIEKLQKDD